jgi:DNA-binding MarR family transcriptional regulator
MNYRPEFDHSLVYSAEGRGSFGADRADPSPCAFQDVWGPPTPERLAALAEKIHGVRSRRAAYLGSEAIAEAAWEMLIALYRADCAFHRLTVTNLCLASEAPSTTALRWIDRLVELNLVYRRNNPLDARVIFVELLPNAKQAIHSYLCDIWVILYSPDH